MARLDITKGTLKKLFALSGNQCAFPKCPQRIFNEHGDLIGDVAHIEAANEEGERYNPDQTDEDRRSFDNLFVLCRNHHRTTDNVEEYPVERLQEMKRAHESQFAGQPVRDRRRGPGEVKGPNQGDRDHPLAARCREADRPGVGTRST